MEKVIIDIVCRDTDASVIKDEIEIYLRDKAEQFVFKDKYFYLKDTDICLSGDNLITKNV